MAAGHRRSTALTVSLVWTPDSSATSARPVDHAKKTYALLQTPEFVEEFILDRTMEPALADRRWKASPSSTRPVAQDISCSARSRLHERWQRGAGRSARELVAKALDGVYRVDINRSQCRSHASGYSWPHCMRLATPASKQNIGYTPHLAAGDSLLWERISNCCPKICWLGGNSARFDRDAGR